MYACVKQGCERVVAPRRATMLSDAIYLRLRVSPLLFSLSLPLSAFSTVWFLFLSYACLLHALHTPPCFSYPLQPIVNISLPPSLFASKYQRYVFHPSSFFSFSRNKPTKYTSTIPFSHDAPTFFFSFPPLFLSFFFNKHVREKCRRSRGKISERIPLPLVRKGESKEEKRNALGMKPRKGT